MRIELIRPDQQKDFIFQIAAGKKTLLTSSDYSNKSDCLDQLKSVLVDLRDNEQISIQSGNNNLYYFEVLNLAQSASFDDIEAASDVLARLKIFAVTTTDFEIIYKKTAKRVVSKKQLGLREESYNFNRKSTTQQAGFELFTEENGTNLYFHFNDAKGKPIFYSRAFDGKTQRIKAIRSIIKNAKNNKRFELIEQDGQYFFIIKTSKDYEIGRSKSFSSQQQMESAIAFLGAKATDFKKEFKLSKKKKKKKRKAQEKYHLKQLAPIGLIGFEGFKSSKNKLHYFHYHDEDGQALLFSKPYDKRSLREASIAYIIKNGKKDKVYKTWKKSKKQHYFSIIDKKGKSFARSCYFESEKDMIAAMKNLQDNVAGFEQELNVVAVTKDKKYKIQLPEVAKEEGTESAAVTAAAVGVVAPTIVATEAEEIVEVEQVDMEELETIEETVIETGVEIEEERITESIAPPIYAESKPKPVYERPTSFKKEIIEAKPSFGFPWKWLIIGLIGLAALLALFKYCSATAVPKVAPKPEEKVVEKVAPKPAPVEPAKLGPTALELNLTPNTAEARIADFLSAPKVKVPKVFILESVQFPFNSAQLTNASHAQLNNVAKVMKEYPKTKIEVNGHTDSRGEPAKNIILSENRAKAVQNYLIAQGISGGRILKAIGFGETDPIATNDTDAGRQENRRSEVVVVER